MLAVLQWLWQGCVDLTADIVTLGGHLFDLLGGLILDFRQEIGHSFFKVAKSCGKIFSIF